MSRKKSPTGSPIRTTPALPTARRRFTAPRQASGLSTAPATRLPCTPSAAATDGRPPASDRAALRGGRAKLGAEHLGEEQCDAIFGTGSEDAKDAGYGLHPGQVGRKDGSTDRCRAVQPNELILQALRNIPVNKDSPQPDEIRGLYTIAEVFMDTIKNQKT